MNSTLPVHVMRGTLRVALRASLGPRATLPRERSRIRSVALLEAKLIAHAELFRLFQDDWESALIDPALNRLADTADAEQLASELCSWPSSIGMQPSDDVIERLRSLQDSRRQ